MFPGLLELCWNTNPISLMLSRRIPALDRLVTFTAACCPFPSSVGAWQPSLLFSPPVTILTQALELLALLLYRNYLCGVTGVLPVETGGHCSVFPVAFEPVDHLLLKAVFVFLFFLFFFCCLLLSCWWTLLLAL